MFFVLSGFLITDILIKEIQRDGSINTFHFLRSRFLRIWPALFVDSFFNLYFGETMWNGFLTLFFVSNFFGIETHLWSVCVEFQFYLLSPLIVGAMFKAKRPWLIVLTLCLISMGANLGMFLHLDPSYLSRNDLMGVYD